MILRGVDFGTAWNAAGALNFFGDGYWFHDLPFVGPDFSGATFVAKTTTLEPRAGNMPLRFTTPRELLPRCIRVNMRRGAVLNAVGLSGPGLGALLDDGRWQARRRPFLLSFMAVGGDEAARRDEHERAARLLRAARAGFHAPFGLEVNFSCPNVGVAHDALEREVGAAMRILRANLGDTPLIAKVNALVPAAVARRLSHIPWLDAICCSNALPWGALPHRIDWHGLFGPVSPLAHLGGGALSGAPLTDIAKDWIVAASAAGVTAGCPLVACGGIMRRRDAAGMLARGAAAFEVGAAAIVRSWRVARLVRTPR